MDFRCIYISFDDGYFISWIYSSVGANVLLGCYGNNKFVSYSFIGEGLKTWLLGDYTVGNATLNEFCLHYVLPFIIFGNVGLHVAAVHVHGSNNHRYRYQIQNDTVLFPYMLIKDTIAVCVLVFLFQL